MKFLDFPSVGYIYSEPESEEDASTIPRSWLKPLEVHFDASCHCVEEEDRKRFEKQGLMPDEINDYEFRYMSHLISQVGLGAGNLISEVLNNQIHIGPLRKVPRSRDVKNWKDASWSDGSQAWVELVDPKYHALSDFSFGETDGENKYVNPITGHSSKEIDRAFKAFNVMCHGPAEDDYGHLTKLVNSYFVRNIGLRYQIKIKNSRNIDMDGSVFSLLKRLIEQPCEKPVSSDLQKVLEEIKKRPVRREIVLIENETGIELRPSDLGTGVSQLIPVLVGLAVPSRVFSVEQPELHLHPALQCNLGDAFIFGRVVQDDRIMLVETHSEHLILRLLRRIRETAQGQIPNEGCALRLSLDDLAVLYVDQASDGIRVNHLRVDVQGQFIDEWPGGFFEEGFNEIAGGL